MMYWTALKSVAAKHEHGQWAASFEATMELQRLVREVIGCGWAGDGWLGRKRGGAVGRLGRKRAGLTVTRQPSSIECTHTHTYIYICICIYKYMYMYIYI